MKIAVPFTAVLLALLMLTGCGRSARTGREHAAPREASYAEGRELFCTVESREEAEEIAELYGIELVSFSYRVATFHTEEDPGAVVQRGRDNGWKALSVNTSKKMF